MNSRALYPSGQDGAILISRLVPQDQRSFFGVLSHIINPLLTKIVMTGYWPRSFFACLWTSTSSRSINTQKKNLANIQSS